MGKTTKQFVSELRPDVSGDDKAAKRREKNHDSDVRLVREILREPLGEEESEYTPEQDAKLTERLGADTRKSTLVIQEKAPRSANPIESGPLSEAIRQFEESNEAPRERLKDGEQGTFNEEMFEEGALANSFCHVPEHRILDVVICRSKDEKFLKTMEQKLREDSAIYFNGQQIGEIEDPHAHYGKLTAKIFAIPGKWLLLESLWKHARSAVSISTSGSVLEADHAK